MCEHGIKRAFKLVMQKSGEIGHVFECVAVADPDSGKCPGQWISKLKEIK